jgi:hypothetical protein
MIIVGLGLSACSRASGIPSSAATVGWLGGEPTWTNDTDRDEAVDAAPESLTAAVARTDDARSPVIAAASDGRVTTGGGDVISPPTSLSGLRAGSVDDNEDFEGYLRYLDRVHALGIPLRDFDPTGRIVVSVIDADDRAVAGVEIVVEADGDEIARLRTTADGTVQFHPRLYGSDSAAFTFSSGGVSRTTSPGADVTLRLGDTKSSPAGPVALDVLFLLDATGSMGDEIDRLKTSIDSVAERISQVEPRPRRPLRHDLVPR